MAESKSATLYVRGLPEDLVRGVKVLAAQRGITVRDLVAETLRAAVREAPAAPADQADELADDIAWYERNRDHLAQRYPGEYLAIVGQEVVDHDDDLGPLTIRTHQRYGDRPVLMPDTQRGQRAVHLRSPRASAG